MSAAAASAAGHRAACWLGEITLRAGADRPFLTALARRLLAEAGEAPAGVRPLIMAAAADPSASTDQLDFLARTVRAHADVIARGGDPRSADAARRAAALLVSYARVRQ